MVFPITIIASCPFTRIESFSSNKNLGYKSFSVSTCGILAGIKGASISDFPVQLVVLREQDVVSMVSDSF